MEMSTWYYDRQQKGVRVSTWTSKLFDDDIDGFPLRPVWPGFLISTFFYAAILWMLFFVTGAVRRTIRIKRGLCPKCGYNSRPPPITPAPNAALHPLPPGVLHNNHDFFVLARCANACGVSSDEILEVIGFCKT